MASYHSYCAICGAQAEVAHDGLEARLSDALVEADSGLEWPNDVTEVTRNAYSLSEEDGDYLIDLVMIGPYDENEGEIIDSAKIVPDSFPPDPEEAARVVAFDRNNIRIVRDLECGPYHSTGSVQKIDSEKIYDICPGVYMLAHNGCVDLLTGFTTLTPNTFWDLYRLSTGAESGFMRDSLLRGISYREVEDTIDLLVCPLNSYEEEELVDMLREENPNPARLHDFWFGKGAMFCFVRPDVFPIEQARINQAAIFTTWAPATNINESSNITPALQSPAILTTLPIELRRHIFAYLNISSFLALMATSKATRSTNISSSTIMCLLRCNIPWAFPCCEREQLEVDEAIEEYKDALDFTFWLSYARECIQRSRSMRNRERIWKIVQDMQGLAIQKGVL